MKFKKIDGSVDAEGPIEDLLDELTTLFENDEDFLIVKRGSNQVKTKVCKEGKGCTLELYYYYDPTLTHVEAYRNGVWIKINGNSSLWLYVHRNSNLGKKVCVFSEKMLSCTPVKQVLKSYYLPLGFNKIPACYEKQNVTSIKNQGPDFLQEEIKSRLCCVCTVR